MSDTAVRAEFPYDEEAVRREYARAGLPPVAVAAAGATAFAIPSGAATATAIAIIVAVALAAVAGAAHFKKRRHRPGVVMDSEGAEITAMDTRLRWTDVAEIRVVPFPGRAGRRGHRAVGLVLHDPGPLLTRLRRRPRRRAWNAMAVYGTPVAITDVTLADTAEEIALAAAELSGLPVRWFDR